MRDRHSRWANRTWTDQRLSVGHQTAATPEDSPAPAGWMRPAATLPGCWATMVGNCTRWPQAGIAAKSTHALRKERTNWEEWYARLPRFFDCAERRRRKRFAHKTLSPGEVEYQPGRCRVKINEKSRQKSAPKLQKQRGWAEWGLVLAPLATGRARALQLARDRLNSAVAAKALRAGNPNVC